MNIEIFNQGYEIQRKIASLEALKVKTEEEIKRVFPETISFGNKEPAHWKMTNDFRREVLKQFNDKIDVKIKDLKKQFKNL